jgi:hypothetical protein
MLSLPLNPYKKVEPVKVEASIVLLPAPPGIVITIITNNNIVQIGSLCEVVVVQIAIENIRKNRINHCFSP